MEKNKKMIMILAIAMGILIVVAIVGIVFVSISKSKNGSGKIIVQTTGNPEEAIKAEQQQKMNEFNGKFNPYVGRKISGTLVKSLISEAILNNNTNEEQQVIVKLLETDFEDGTDDVTELSDMQLIIGNEYIYSVECNENSETGYIEEIVIKLEDTVSTSPEVQEFNENFMQYEDEIISGIKVKEELVELIKNINRENPDHKITMYSGELSSINDLSDTADYKITLTYDEEGYINRIDADEQVTENGNSNLQNQVSYIAVETFNSIYLSYEGTEQGASQIRSLISTVKANNATNEEHQISMQEPDILSSSAKYFVELEYDSDGYVNNIIVTEAQ